MKNINPTFTDEEHEELMKYKNFIGLSWHDLLLKIFKDGVERGTQMLIDEGYTKEEIEEMFNRSD